ncbi:PEP-CTERM sorting domain-containing protein [Povalibacter sp.]|uniref:PEP-CTERM sorting domain-containing protein n=1 Tax=Povalibacter sp. TaxID=1962978 RepID=UPI002F4161AD
MKRTGLCIAGALALAWSLPSEATLINYGSSTHDTATGLEWLDVNLTSGLTYNSVLNDAGGFITDGWRYATGAEIDALAGRYIGSPEETFSGGLDFIETLIMIGLLEPTFERSFVPGITGQSLTIATLGYYDDETGGSRVGLAEFMVNVLVPAPGFGDSFTGRWTTFDDFLAPNTLAPQIGSFLVRSTSVPEPGTMGLLSIGLLALVFARRNARK